MFSEPITIRLDVVDSTNNYAANVLKQTKLPEFSLIVTKRQEKGKGQRGTTWQSEPEQNFTGTFVIYPSIHLHAYYILQKATAIAAKEVIEQCLPHEKIEIKWPNDIYVNQQKIGGILLESQVKKNAFEYVLLGIGINVNQVDFDPKINATSIAKNTGQKTNLIDFESALQASLIRNLRPLKESKIDQKYRESLYGLHQKMKFQKPNGTEFNGKIEGVSKEGLLVVQLENGSTEMFDLKEIIFTHEFLEDDASCS